MLPISKAGNSILSDMYEEFRAYYLSMRPDASENDCEKGFLYQICASAVGLDKSDNFNHQIKQIG